MLVERKQAEEALQNNEKRFRALIENGLDDISLLAADGTLLWESPSTIRNLGYEPDEFVGRNIFEFMHPDDLEWTRDMYAKLLQRTWQPPAWNIPSAPRRWHMALGRSNCHQHARR